LNETPCLHIKQHNLVQNSLSIKFCRQASKTVTQKLSVIHPNIFFNTVLHDSMMYTILFYISFINFKFILRRGLETIRFSYLQKLNLTMT